jgi:hypothetical protein
MSENMTTIRTTANIKKITSGKGVEIVLSLPSSVSLDELSELKQRDEFYIALGVSQMEVRDYLEPRRGYQAKVDGSGVVQSVSNPGEDDDEGEQLAIDVETEQEQLDEINEEEAERKRIDSELLEQASSEPDDQLIRSEGEGEGETVDEQLSDPDAPLTFVDSNETDNW